MSALRDTDGRPQQELGDALLLDANSLSLLLNALEDRGFLTRTPDRHDRRRHFIELTEAGRAAVERAEAALDATERDVLDTLDTDERRQLRALAAKALQDVDLQQPSGTSTGV